MDIVAALTKVVQEQKRALEDKTRLIDDQQATFAAQLAQLKTEIDSIKNRDAGAQR
jgi:septal ring factor EnvC (AmiA/AmiB activator)